MEKNDFSNSNEKTCIFQVNQAFASFDNSFVTPADEDIKLTKCEYDILRLLSLGGSYANISDSCGISINTVRFHIKNIYSKMNVNSSLKALSKARAIGLI